MDGNLFTIKIKRKMTEVAMCIRNTGGKENDEYHVLSVDEIAKKMASKDEHVIIHIMKDKAKYIKIVIDKDTSCRFKSGRGASKFISSLQKKMTVYDKKCHFVFSMDIDENDFNHFKGSIPDSIINHRLKFLKTLSHPVINVQQRNQFLVEIQKSQQPSPIIAMITYISLLILLIISCYI